MSNLPLDYRQAIGQEYPQLRGKKRKMADLLLNAPLEMIGKSVAQFAALCDCDQTTVVRFAQQLGYSGYTELKIALARGADTLWKDFEADSSDGDVDEFRRMAENLVRLHFESMRATLAGVTRELLEDVADRVENASRVMICGSGSSALAAEDLALKLLRLGVSTLNFRDPELWKTFLGHLGAADLLILFSNSGENAEIVRLAQQAERAGIPVAAITSVPGGSLAKHAKWLICTQPRGEHPIRLGAMTSRSAQFVISDLLVLVFSRRNKERSWKYLERGYENYVAPSAQL